MSAGQAVAVIGAGVVGVACARALQRAGHKVTIYDPEPPGRGCSFGNAGHIAVDHIRPLARLDVLAQVPRMLTDPLSPLADRKSTRLNSSHTVISYAVFCLKKKKQNEKTIHTKMSHNV